MEKAWFENLDLGTQMPRSKKFAMQSARDSLNNPVFARLQEKKEFKRIAKMLEEVIVD